MVHSRAIIQIVKERVGLVSLDPSGFQCPASLSFHVVHRTVLTSCCQPLCLTLCAVVRLSHLEDTEAVVNVMWYILLLVTLRCQCLFFV